ncbi:MAG: hypothetical protein AAF394_03370, partial [Planctomycetota bacterium]
MSFRICSAVLCFALAMVLVGCEGSWEASTYPAMGSISINGQIPEGAVVELRSVGDAPDVRDSRPWGLVDASGNYTLTTYKQNDGAPVGEYAVTVRWPPTISKPSLEDKLNGAYSDPNESKWKVSIAAEDNLLAKIEIKGAKLTARS